MKINPNFLLKNIAGNNVVVPVGAAGKKLNGMITLKNESSLYLWKCFEDETTAEEVVDKVIKEFGVERDAAVEYVENFVKKLSSYGVFD